jgi:hypothetical protein
MGILDWHDGFVPKVAATSTISYIVSDVAAKLLWNHIQEQPETSFTKRFAKRWLPHHYQLGSSAIMLGALNFNAGWSPLAVGAGIGMVASDFQDWIKQADRIFPDRDISDKYNIGELNDTYSLTTYDIPDWLPREWKYEFISQLLKKIVTEPTLNKKTFQWVPAAKEHPAVIAQARKILVDAGIDGRNKYAVARAVQLWTQKNIGYCWDPRGTDTFVHPYRLLDWKSGDCDDHSLLVSSVLEALGIPSVMIMVAQKNPNMYNHILAGAVIDGRIVPLETTIPAELGWHPQCLRRGIIQV